MIVFPKNWRNIGKQITPDMVNNTLSNILNRLDCYDLSFSGGIDSSLLLWHMSDIYGTVHAYTMGSNENHPDIVYAKKVVNLFSNVKHHIYIPYQKDIDIEKDNGEEFAGDATVRLFYKWVSQHTNHIIAGDGIDEYMCGYYDHQNKPDEEMYYSYIRRLQKEQLRPLNKNSGNINVFLPYIAERMILLLSQIPLTEKVDNLSRKKIMSKLIEGKLPLDIFNRRKRGFLCALKPIKEPEYA